MQSDRNENAAMQGIAVALLTEDREQLVVLQNRLESTHVARTVFSHIGFPVSATDPVVRQVQDQHAEVVIIDVNSNEPQRAIRAVELIRGTIGAVAIFVVGEMCSPTTIVGAMRAGAAEFIDRSEGVQGLFEAFTRLSGAHNENPTGSAPRGGSGGSGGSDPSGGAAPPAVPIGIPRGGVPRTLPSKKMARGA